MVVRQQAAVYQRVTIIHDLMEHAASQIRPEDDFQDVVPCCSSKNDQGTNCKLQHVILYDQHWRG
jgi:hypothetical protein